MGGCLGGGWGGGWVGVWVWVWVGYGCVRMTALPTILAVVSLELVCGDHPHAL
jgi:hypothetical protein